MGGGSRGRRSIVLGGDLGDLFCTIPHSRTSFVAAFRVFVVGVASDLQIMSVDELFFLHYLTLLVRRRNCLWGLFYQAVGACL